MIVNQIHQFSATVTPEELFSHKIYWLNQLSGEIPETNFLTDYVRPINLDGKNKYLNFELSKNLSSHIIHLTNRSYLSIYLVLVATLNILLYKYTGNHDIVVGLPLYREQNRNNVVNKILPLRSLVNNQLSFHDLLNQTKKTLIDAYVHRNYPVSELFELLNIPQALNRNPICDIVILLENIHDSNHLSSIQNDLTFSFTVTEDKIQGKIEYKDFLFKDESIKAIINSYINILNNIIQNPHTSISDISCITETEEHQLLSEFNSNFGAYPVNKTLHQLFEEQVKLTPERTAVVGDRNKLTYEELNTKANQVAKLLQNLDVRDGDFVGICKQRDINFLIAILAILKAGGVYVPIDSTYPLDRIRYMVSNSKVKWLLTDSSCLHGLTTLLKDCSQLKHLVCLDTKPSEPELYQIIAPEIYDQLDFEKLPQENLEVNNTGIDPAYTIYTSGSTGLPKGAIIRHGGAINHIYAQFDALELNESLNFLQTAPASSDISVWQFLAPIIIGGKTIIVNTETVCNPEQLFKIIKEEKITIIELVPVVLTALIEYIHHLSVDERLLPNLKWMMVTGESASVELVNKWLQLYPSIKVVNAYGPTEAADDITQFIIDKPLPENQRTVPIGKPLANLNLYILDAQMQLVPIGAPGEICVSGFGVGLGYWKNKENTDSSFVPNPFMSTAKPLPGTHRDLIYKTGDLGRWLPDGNIEFLGRIDHQVKIRGFRIELGEIEAVLGQHPDVKETVVVVKEDSPGDKRLVGYIVLSLESQVLGNDLDSELKSQNSASIHELLAKLRNFLRERLPEYMVPSYFMLLKALPLSPSGKVDRQALPAPNILTSDLEGSFVPPRTPTEKVVVDIWTHILGREGIGIYDNFFDLGGHSLMAIQVISQLREAFELELPLRSLFEEPTIAKLAERIEKILTVQKLQAPIIANVDNREEIEL
jgi:amino acid adenylation domain-containing protein